MDGEIIKTAARYASQPAMPQGQPGGMQMGGFGSMTNVNRFGGLFGMGMGTNLGAAAQAGQNRPNPLTSVKPGQHGLATAGGIQQAMQKGASSHLAAHPDWLLTLVPYLNSPVKQAEVGTGGNSAPAASTSSLGGGAGNASLGGGGKQMGTPQGALGSQNQQGQQGQAGGLGVNGAMQGQLGSSGGQIGAYGVVRPGWSALRPSVGPNAGVTPGISGTTKLAMMTGAPQPTPGLTANAPVPPQGGPAAPPPMPGGAPMPPPNGGAPIPGGMGQPSVDPATGQPIVDQAAGGGAPPVDPATGQPMPPPPQTQVDPLTGMPSTSPMQDPPPLPLPMNPRMTPPRPANATDHAQQGMMSGLMDDKKVADQPMNAGEAQEDMQSEAMAMGSKTAWDVLTALSKTTFEKGAVAAWRNAANLPKVLSRLGLGQRGVPMPRTQALSSVQARLGNAPGAKNLGTKLNQMEPVQMPGMYRGEAAPTAVFRGHKAPDGTLAGAHYGGVVHASPHPSITPYYAGKFQVPGQGEHSLVSRFPVGPGTKYTPDYTLAGRTGDAVVQKGEGMTYQQIVDRFKTDPGKMTGSFIRSNDPRKAAYETNVAGIKPDARYLLRRTPGATSGYEGLSVPYGKGNDAMLNQMSQTVKPASDLADPVSDPDAFALRFAQECGEKAAADLTKEGKWLAPWLIGAAELTGVGANMAGMQNDDMVGRRPVPQQKAPMTPAAAPPPRTPGAPAPAPRPAPRPTPTAKLPANAAKMPMKMMGRGRLAPAFALGAAGLGAIGLGKTAAAPFGMNPWLDPEAADIGKGLGGRSISDGPPSFMGGTPAPKVDPNAATRTYVGPTPTPASSSGMSATRSWHGPRPKPPGMMARVPGGRAGLLMGGLGLLGGLGASQLPKLFQKKGSQADDGKSDTAKSATGESKGLAFAMRDDHHATGKDAWSSVSGYFKGGKGKNPKPWLGKHASVDGTPGDNVIGNPAVNGFPKPGGPKRPVPKAGQMKPIVPMGNGQMMKTCSYDECTPFARGFFEACDKQGVDLNYAVEKVGNDFGEEAQRELRDGLEKVAKQWLTQQGGRAVEFGRGLFGGSLKPGSSSMFGAARPSASMARDWGFKDYARGAATRQFAGSAAGYAGGMARPALTTAFGGLGGGLAGDDLGLGGDHTDVLGMKLNTRGMYLGMGASNPFLRRQFAGRGYARGAGDVGGSMLRRSAWGSLGGHAADQTLYATGIDKGVQEIDPTTGQPMIDPQTGQPMMKATNRFGRLGAYAGLGAGALQRGGYRLARQLPKDNWLRPAAHYAGTLGHGAGTRINNFAHGTFDPIIGGLKAGVRKPIEWAGGTAPQILQRSTAPVLGSRVAGRIVGGVGLGAGALGMGSDWLDNKIRGSMREGGAELMAEGLPVMQEQMDNYLGQRGMLDENGQFDPTQAVQRRGGPGGMFMSGADGMFRSMGMDPSKMSPLQKIMILGGATAGAGGLLAGAPVMAGVGGASAAAGLLPMLMPGQSQQQFGTGPTAPYRPGQQQTPNGMGPGGTPYPNQPGARDEWAIQQQMGQH